VRRAVLVSVLAACAPFVGAQTRAATESTVGEPWKGAVVEPLDYRGPGRELEEPDAAEVVLGWFAPAEADHPVGAELWRGARLGLDEENGSGGYGGRPFRLAPAWSESPWAAGIADLTRVIYEDGAWAVLGAIDGTSAHLAEQVALKSRITLVSVGSTDATASMGNVPWLFSCLPSDDRQVGVLVDALVAAGGRGSFVVAAAAEHDSHSTLVQLRRELGARRLALRALVEFDPGDGGSSALAGRLLEPRPSVVVVLAPSTSAGRLVAGLRRAGFSGTVIGGATLARRAFARVAGAASEGVLVPRLWEPSAAWDRFARAYEERWHEPADDVAAQSYDAVRLVAAAVRRAGLNRARIRDTLRTLAPWRGAAGELRWDVLGRNERTPGLARWSGRRLEPLSSL